MKTILQEIVQNLRRKPCWNVKQGYGTSLTFEFGNPHLRILDPAPTSRILRRHRRGAYVHGDWHLWIYCYTWIYHQDGLRIAKWTSPTKKVQQVCNLVNGQTLSAIDIEAAGAKTTFQFDLGGMLVTSSLDKDLLEHWSLRCPNGKFFAFRSDGRCSYESGQISHLDKRFVPMVDSPSHRQTTKTR